MSLSRGAVLPYDHNLPCLLDGFSEMPNVDPAAIRPDGGALDTSFVVITSREPTHLPDAVVVRPLGFDLADLDRLLDAFVIERLGFGRVSGEQREKLRARVKELVTTLGRDEVGERGLPTIFLKLMVDRARQLLDQEQTFDELPRTIVKLVDDYTCRLLRAETDQLEAIRNARRAAVLCLAEDLRPAWRPITQYEACGLSHEVLDTLVACGLAVDSGSRGDPHFKFALDPVAEYLAAWEWVLRIRDRIEERQKLRETIEAVTGSPPDGFLAALVQWAEEYGLDVEELVS